MVRRILISSNRKWRVGTEKRVAWEYTSKEVTVGDGWRDGTNRRSAQWWMSGAGRHHHSTNNRRRWAAVTPRQALFADSNQQGRVCLQLGAATVAWGRAEGGGSEQNKNVFSTMLVEIITEKKVEIKDLLLTRNIQLSSRHLANFYTLLARHGFFKTQEVKRVRKPLNKKIEEWRIFMN